ncbi:TetR/AcrR family transcriptional regulator [Saccharothrix australiensis]|uniref:TetR family transcriptional regulator n=1 Tax=Saccharothrix australiensis TaxID=2072 RepID=A0A495VZD1_9PSEU|nr:TetR/AcrR family transcriptional regulator [Saccharothrix australiensis]RKT53883.1 TetR family transcriptional regulator [Saccharothrix australiensis]
MPERPRADARRNHDLLVTVAAEAFAEQGADASLRDIARRAGVGIGTLYRHFPTREALLAALLDHRFALLRTSAEALLAAEPAEALRHWLTELAHGSATYRGLPESVLAALRDEGSGLHASCAAMRAAAARLLARAQEAGAVAPTVTPEELLTLAVGAAWGSERSAIPVERLLSLAIDGLAAVPRASGTAAGPTAPPRE